MKRPPMVLTRRPPRAARADADPDDRGERGGGDCHEQGQTGRVQSAQEVVPAERVGSKHVVGGRAGAGKAGERISPGSDGRRGDHRNGHHREQDAAAHTQWGGPSSPLARPNSMLSHGRSPSAARGSRAPRPTSTTALATDATTPNTSTAAWITG